MLFNSYAFIFAFLPITLAGFLALGRVHPRAAAAWLACASLFFYGWWNPAFVPLLVLSMVGNYAFGLSIARTRGACRPGLAQSLLVCALVANLGVLAYFKYAKFLLANLGWLLPVHLDASGITLPLGISFFTFTQIAFLVDVHQGKAREYNPIHYGLFVTYFPHLIAGPILHHREMMPQFDEPATYKLNHEHLAVGITIFAIGLFKKVVIADGVAPWGNAVFDAADAGIVPTPLECWAGALAYTFQLYFDFSGYSDMAIGLARMFSTKLPINFASPYRATNIIEFWRRWHITLSRFLRDYVYVALGGNRRGQTRRYVNLLVTMLLGGLWHGAAWTFVFWGFLHGLYLIANHAWHALKRVVSVGRFATPWMRDGVARVLTFVAVIVAWVFFRAHSFDGAARVVSGMAGRAPQPGAAHEALIANPRECAAWLAVLLACVWLMPNAQELAQRFRPGLETYGIEYGAGSRRIALAFTPAWALLTIGLLLAAIAGLSRAQEFLYFTF